MKSANVSPELAAIAYDIADEMSQCDIESNCAPVLSVGVKWWHVYAEASLNRSIQYLAARGLLISHPDRPDWVRFRRIT